MNAKAISITGLVLPNGELALDGPIHSLEGPVRVIVEPIELPQPASDAWVALDEAWGEQRARYHVEVANGEMRGVTLVETEAWQGERNTRGLSWAAADLCDFMSQISEDCYCAGWLTSLEFELWACVMNGPVHKGNWDITQSHIDRLRFLARRCGGWIIWDTDAKHQTWIAIDEWLERYRRHVQGERPNK